MYYQNPPSFPEHQMPQGLAAPQAAQPLLPSSPPALPAFPSAAPLSQASPRAELPNPRPSSRPTAPGVLHGHIVPQTLRFFSNGVSRFRFFLDDSKTPIVSCVMFRTTTDSFPSDALSKGAPLELHGYAKANNWIDKKGNAHADTDFVVTSLVKL